MHLFLVQAFMKGADKIHKSKHSVPSLLWDELTPVGPLITPSTMRRTRRIRISNVAFFIILASLFLLYIHTCDSYMSTLHLGRAVQALKAEEQWQQQQFNDARNSNSTSISEHLDVEAGETVTSVKAGEVTTSASERVVGDNGGKATCRMDDKSPTTNQSFPTAEQSSPMAEKLSITAGYISKGPTGTGDQETVNRGIQELTSLEPVNHPPTVEQSPGTAKDPPKGLTAAADAQVVDHNVQETTPPERGNPQMLEDKPAPHQSESDLLCEISSEASAAALSNQVYPEACQGSGIGVVGASPSRSEQHSGEEKDHNTNLTMEVRAMVLQEVFPFRDEAPPEAVGVFERRGLQSPQVEPLDPRRAPGTKHQGPEEEQMPKDKREEEEGGKEEGNDVDKWEKGEHREEKREYEKGPEWQEEQEYQCHEHGREEGQMYREEWMTEMMTGEGEKMVRVEEDDKGKDVMEEHRGHGDSGEEDVQRQAAELEQQRDKEKNEEEELQNGREAGEVSRAREETSEGKEEQQMIELCGQEEERDEEQRDEEDDRDGAHDGGYEQRHKQEGQGGEEVKMAMEVEGQDEKQEESGLDEKGGKREGEDEPINGMECVVAEGDEQEVELEDMVELDEQRDGTEDQSSELITVLEEARRDGRQERLRRALEEKEEGNLEEDALMEDVDEWADEKNRHQGFEEWEEGLEEGLGVLEYLCESEGLCSRMECLCTKLRDLKDLAELEDELWQMRAEKCCDTQLEDEGEGQNKWQGGGLVVDAEGSVVDGCEEATQELLRLWEAQDLKVREAAARAAEGLPVTQRECYEELETFAFGSGGGGLSEEDAGTLDAMAICGDRTGLVLAFLRQSKFDVQRAKEAMRRCCAWRRGVEVNAVFSRQASLAKIRKHHRHWSMGFHRWDRLGRPVFYSRVGQADLDGLDKDDMVDTFCLNVETQRRFTLARLSREAGRPVDRVTIVFDLKGLGERQAKAEGQEVVLYCVRRISEILRDNNLFEMASDLLVVNAPSWLANMGWHAIEEGVLDGEMKAKVRIFGEENSVALKQLEAYIPRRNIPDFLGGDSPSVLGSDPNPAAGTNVEDPCLDDLAVGHPYHRAGTMDDVASSPSRGTTARKATAVAPGGEAIGEVKDRTQRTRRGRVAVTRDRESRPSRRRVAVGERREGSAASCTPRRKREDAVCWEAVRRGKEGRAGEGEIESDGILTALLEVLKGALGGISAAGKALLRVVDLILRLLRDVFFEQVEVEEF